MNERSRDISLVEKAAEKLHTRANRIKVLGDVAFTGMTVQAGLIVHSMMANDIPPNPTESIGLAGLTLLSLGSFMYLAKDMYRNSNVQLAKAESLDHQLGVLRSLDNNQNPDNY